MSTLINSPTEVSHMYPVNWLLSSFCMRLQRGSRIALEKERTATRAGTGEDRVGQVPESQPAVTVHIWKLLNLLLMKRQLRCMNECLNF